MRQLTAEGCRARRAALLERVEADFIVITNPRHIFYLSGLYITPLALSGWGHNYLLLTASGEAVLIVHNLLEGDAKNAHVDRVESWLRYDALHQPATTPFAGALDALKRHLPPGRAAVEYGLFPHGAVDSAVDITPTLLELRRSKHDDELALIREAVSAVEAGFGAARAAAVPGASETEVYSAIHAAIVEHLGSPVLLLGDYVSTRRTGGGPPTGYRLQARETMITDIFPIVNGYRADCTATLAVGGTLSDDQLRLETALHEAQAAGATLLRPGVRAAEVYHAVKAVMSAYGYGEAFSHHAGHGLGLDHPEAPYFVPDSPDVLVEGDVVTLEPGAYGEGWGARIEHNYLITAAGAEQLSHHRTAFV